MELNTELHEIIAYGDDARKQLITGIDKVAKAVGSTMGPCGQNVIIGKNGDEDPVITKDGITVADAVELIEPIESMGGRIVKQAARKTVEEVSDGTTTCTVLTSALINAIPADLIPFRQELIELFNDSEKKIYESLDNKFFNEATEEKVHQAALTSCNGDEELAGAISSLVFKLGADASITAKSSNTDGVFTQIFDGYYYEKGFVSPNFINVPEESRIIRENVKVILVDGNLEDFQDLIFGLNVTRDQHTVVIANSFSNSFINNCIASREFITPIIAPVFGMDQNLILQDLVAFTGAPIINSNYIDRNNKIDYNYGKLDKISQNISSTVLHVNEPTKEIQNRIAMLEANLKVDFSNKNMKEKLKARISSLKQDKAIIHIGGGVDAAVGERFDRAEDALGAARQAMKGVIPGGGCALLWAGSRLNNELSNALAMPFKTILNNRGVSEDQMKEAMRTIIDQEEPNLIIDPISLQPKNAHESGVLDPINVTKTVVKYSFSAALQILTTGCALQSNFVLR